jgi:hypothetical protein
MDDLNAGSAPTAGTPDGGGSLLSTPLPLAPQQREQAPQGQPQQQATRQQGMDGGQSQDWRTSLPEDLRDHPSLRKYNSLDQLAKGYVHAESMIGRDKVPLPKDENDKEALDRVYSALGRPEDPDKYEVERPQNLPADQYDEDGEKFLRKFAHENGWNQKQFKNAYKAYLERSMQQQNSWQQAQVADKQEGERSLRRKWGDAYEGELQKAQIVVKDYWPEAAVKKLEQFGLANDPDIIEALARTGKDVVGDTRLRGANQFRAQTPDQLKTRIDEHRSQHASALLDDSHPEHKMRTREQREMFRQLYGE